MSMANIAVLPVCRVRFSGPSARAWIGAAASTLASISNIRPRPDPFGPPSGSRISACRGSVVGSPSAVSTVPARQRRAGCARLQNLAVRDRARRHVENDRAVAARHRDGDRARAQAGDPRAVIGHQGRTRAHEDGGAVALGDPLRVAPDRAGMRRLANEAEADAGLFCPLDRKRRGLHSSDRPETVAGIEHESRGAVVNQTRLCLRIDLAALDIL